MLHQEKGSNIPIRQGAIVKIRLPVAIGMMRKAVFASLASLTLMFSFYAIAEEPAASKMTGIFSDMTYHEDSSDIIGTEIFLVYSSRGYFAMYQSSEGEPSVPVVVPAKVVGASVSFQIPLETDARGSFQGTIDNEELVGSFSSNGQILHLKRKVSYWQ